MKEVLSFVTNIKGEKFNFKPHKTEAQLNNLSDFLFIEDKNGISNFWVGLEIELIFLKDNIEITINQKNDNIIVSTNDKFRAYHLKKLLEPYLETSLKHKLRILNLENIDNLFI